MPHPLAARLLSRVFRRIVGHGDLSVGWSDGTVERFGDGNPPRAAIRLDGAAERGILTYPSLRLGEAYMDGGLVLEQGTIADLLAILLANRALDSAPRPLRLLADATRWLRTGRFNSLVRARGNVAHHYDLDGRLYDLFLDEARQYSCAFFPRAGMSLDAAQQAKMARIAAKLRPVAGARLLDIGCGWGGLGCRLAEAGFDVTGITLSEEQLEGARRRAAARGVDARFELRDYRDVTEAFDRVVSVGMLEHVGLASLPAYFGRIAAVLERRGIALVHAIGHYGPARPTNPWLDRYIFPGGYIPTLSQAMAAVEASGLLIADIEIWRLHYAETLRHWRERFMARRDEAAALFDERFCRMWEFYLAGSEMGFRHGRFMVFQMLLVKDRSVLPPTRAWMERPVGESGAEGGAVG